MSEESVNQVQEINQEVSTSEGDADRANLMSFDDLDNLIQQYKIENNSKISKSIMEKMLKEAIHL